MESGRIPTYHIAQGPDGLKQVFDKLWENPALRSQPQDVLYSLGNQLSLIKVDFAAVPIKFSYADVTFPFARPAPQTIKNAIVDFCQEQERKVNRGYTMSDVETILKNQFFDQTLAKLLDKQSVFINMSGAKMNIDAEENRLPEDKQQDSAQLFEQLAAMKNEQGQALLPNIAKENVTNLLLAQDELLLAKAAEQKKASASDYGKAGKYPGLFDNKAEANAKKHQPVPVSTDSKTFKR